MEELHDQVEETDLLPALYGWENGKQWDIGDLVRGSSHLPAVIWLRLRQMERIQGWLKGYLQAVAIMLQIPGAAEYHPVECETTRDLHRLVWNIDTAKTLSVMAVALQRLDAAHVLAHAPGGEDFTPQPLPMKARLCLAGLDRMHLLNVVADCLDRLLVAPNIPGELECRRLTPEHNPHGLRPGKGRIDSGAGGGKRGGPRRNRRPKRQSARA